MSFPEVFYCPITKRIMTDPVQDREGNTYERSAIEHWVELHGTSPLTRNRVTASELIPNRALREMISEQVTTPLGVSSGTTGTSNVDSEPIPTPEISEQEVINIEIKAVADPESGDVLISLKPPDTSSNYVRPPMDLCCVIDVSGSMDTVAEIKVRDENGNEHIENNGLTILDVVKHSLKTVISNMLDCDRLSLITFSDSAREILGLRSMTSAARSEAIRIVENIGTKGSTNLWDGLKRGMETLSRSSDSLCNSSLFLLTDGMPNVEPPRGSAEMLKRYREEKGIACTINTFGFGYSLDSRLLNSLAVIGSGTYCFIPDAGMVATVFVHALANLMVTVCNRAILKVEALNGTRLDPTRILAGGYASSTASWGLDIKLGTLQYGQSRDVLLKLHDIGDQPYLRATLSYSAWNSTDASITEVEGQDIVDQDGLMAILRHKHRLKSVDVLRDGLENPNSALLQINQLVDLIRHSESGPDPYLIDLIKDLTGEGSLAFKSENGYFRRWGRHYIPSLSRAHLIQQCNNFKDHGVQHYGGNWFREIRDVVDGVIDRLPPAVPSRRAYDHVSRQYYRSGPINMRMYSQSSDPCIRGDTVVKLKNGNERYVRRLEKGDILENGATVQCVVRTSIPDRQTQLCNLSTEGRPFFITPWHPVYDINKESWVFPRELVPPKSTTCEEIYSFILDRIHVMDVSQHYSCVTLGHDFQDDIRKHSFFGSQEVVEDLSSFPGFESGLVETGGIEYHPDTGLVTGFIRP